MTEQRQSFQCDGTESKRERERGGGVVLSRMTKRESDRETMTKRERERQREKECVWEGKGDSE